jgi:hypothetical protein
MSNCLFFVHRHHNGIECCRKTETISREKRCGSGKKTKIFRFRKSKIQTRSCDWKEKKYSANVKETKVYHEEKMETTKARPEREKTDVRKFSHSSCLPFSPHRTWHIKVD